MSLSNLTSQLASACDACQLMIEIVQPAPTEAPTEAPTGTPDPTAEPTDPPLTKLKQTRIATAAKADPVWCCGQASPMVAREDGNSNNTSALTTAGIDPDNCLECCGKAPEDYWWDDNQVCPASKCTQLYVIKNGAINQFYFFNSNATMVETMPLNAVINGKIITNFPFLRFDSVQEGNGRRRFVLPNGSTASFYTGGDTLTQ